MDMEGSQGTNEATRTRADHKATCRRRGSTQDGVDKEKGEETGTRGHDTANTGEREHGSPGEGLPNACTTPGRDVLSRRSPHDAPNPTSPARADERAAAATKVFTGGPTTAS